MKLTATQMAARLGINSYTLKRWYEFYTDLTEDELNELHKEYNMPVLPKYEVAGSRGMRLWDEEDAHVIEEFKNWVPPTKQGVFKKYSKKEN